MNREIQLENNSVCGKAAFYCKEEVQYDSSGNTIIYVDLCKTHFKKSGRRKTMT